MRAICFLLFCLCIVSCGSPKKYYSKGNYKKAYTSALKELKSGKKDRSLKSILNNSLNEMIEENKAERTALLRSDLIEDWEEAYKSTDDLIDLYYDGNRYADIKYKPTVLSLETENSILKDDIISNYVELGDISMDVYAESGDKRHAQEAYLMYNSALKYDQSMAIGDVKRKAEYALAEGTIIVDVTVDSWDARYNWDIERIYKEIEDNNELFYEISFDKWNQESDCQLEIEFASLDKDIREQRRIENFVEQIQDGYRDQVDTSGNTTRVPVYREVSGQVTIIEQTITFDWDIRVRADNGSGYCDFSSNLFNVSRQIIIANYETSGDERAIPNEYNNNSNQSFTTSDERNVIEDLIEESFDTIERYYF